MGLSVNQIKVRWVRNGAASADVTRDGGLTWRREDFPIALPGGEEMLSDGTVRQAQGGRR